MARPSAWASAPSRRCAISRSMPHHSFPPSAAGDPVSRVRTTTTNGVNDASGVADTFGLVTQFQFTPAAVPEPSGLLLSGIGAVLLVLGHGLGVGKRRILVVSDR